MLHRLSRALHARVGPVAIRHAARGRVAASAATAASRAQFSAPFTAAARASTMEQKTEAYEILDPFDAAKQGASHLPALLCVARGDCIEGGLEE